MLRKLAFSILILLVSLQVKALDAVVSHSIFYVPDPAAPGKYLPEVETYWQINQRKVHYVTNADKKIQGRVRMDIMLLGDSGIINHDRFVIQTPPRSTPEEVFHNSIIDLRRYRIIPGMIHLKVIMIDVADSTNKFAYTDSFFVETHDKEAFYSDIQLLDTTIESATHTAFSKNGHQQLPGCSNFIDEHKKVLHYYAEIYGTTQLSKSELPLIQKIYIARKEGDLAYDNVIKTDTVSPSGSHLVSGSFFIGGQPSGNYFLEMSLEDSTHQIIATRSFFFQRLNPHPDSVAEIVAKKTKIDNDTGIESINVVNLSKTFLAKYDMAQVKSILKMLLPFSDYSATRTIQGFLKKPDNTYMRYYVYNYFLNINKKDPGHAWKEFSSKIVEVNKLFTDRGTPGFQTDRGFMYLRYGPPTEVITVENENGSLPYEIWQYNTLTQTNKKDVANSVMLFYRPVQDVTGFKLLQTNIMGELQNGAWRSFLYNSSAGGSNSTSRAEQYFQ